MHRVVALHRRRLVGRRFRATSPNGRFADGAALIDGRTFVSIEAIGKNLFAWFAGERGAPDVVVHVHFGMAGAWPVRQSANFNFHDFGHLARQCVACVALRGAR